jgi:hypothetical protein
MKPNDRARLTAALRDHVGRIAADLRVKMRTPGHARTRAQQLHADEQIAEDFEGWTDLLSRCASVLWVLKSVYVRVLEDRRLLTPGRLLDQEAQQLFERLAPNLGETAFLRWVYRDLASSNGGLPELFSPQPAEVALPSDELSRRLIAFWRHRDADTGSQWSFAEERFEGELMGDLYQDLDPIVKDRFALCQTPDFVRAFILDRTLTPAIETFGAKEVRLLDPACGSGHFLIDGLKRLVIATAAKHPDWELRRLVLQCLDRVVGIDLNDYACALARARLVMTAAELASVGSLAEAATFHPHIYWADALEQVEKRVDTRGQQQDLLDSTKTETARATLTRPEVRAALRKIVEPGFHAVVANPPYNSEKDAARKAYQRERAGSRRRYVSAHREYSLCCPFTERSFQLSVRDAYVGVIVANSFMTRDFGKPLIETVLANVDLTLVADVSGAILADSGFETPTVMLFARNRARSSDRVRAVLGKKGDTVRGADLSAGPVWTSLLAGWDTPGFDDEHLSVADLPRSGFDKHPWSLRGGGAVQLKQRLESAGEALIRSIEPIGFMCITKQDDVFVQDSRFFARVGAEREFLRPFGSGEDIRDWVARGDSVAVFPYDAGVQTAPLSSMRSLGRYLWRYRTVLQNRAVFGGGTFRTEGRAWWEYGQIPVGRFAEKALTIAFSAIATHNQFEVAREGTVFKQSGPVIQIPNGTHKSDCYTVLGCLNSSTLCFWLRQVLHKVGGRSSGTKRQSESWAQRMDFAGGLVSQAPIPTRFSDSIAACAIRLHELGQSGDDIRPEAVLAGDWSPSNLGDKLDAARAKQLALRWSMVAVQEELDWFVYAAFGLIPGQEWPRLDDVEPIHSEHRPFAIRLARAAERGEATRFWFDAMGVEPCTDVPRIYSEATRDRIALHVTMSESDDTLSTLEAPEYKRRWEPITFSEDLSDASLTWLGDRIEDALKSRTKPVSLAHVVAAVQDDPRFLAVASIYQDRRDVDVTGLVAEIVRAKAIPNHPLHVYTESGLAKHATWEEVWRLQRREDAGERIAEFPLVPEYSQGSRGKSTDFRRNEYWRLRGALDVPRERFTAFMEIPGRSGADTLLGWAGWTPVQRLKAILAIDEELEDAGVLLADRIGLLDSAWRLLPEVAREDSSAATRLKAELQALVGPDGPSRELIQDWRNRFPPSATGANRTSRTVAKREETESDSEDTAPS